MISKLKLLQFILLATFIASCAYNTSLVKTAHDSLQVSQTSYDTSMKIVADLYNRGDLSEEEKSKIIEKATTYSKAHNAAVEALATYEETKDLDDQEKLEYQLEVASSSLQTLLQIIKPYLGD